MKTNQYLHITGAILCLFLFQGCSALTAYNKTVAAREDSITVNADQNGHYGGEYTHRVEYRAFK